MSGIVRVEVPEGADGSRADRFMADAAGLSRAFVQRMIADGRLTSGGRRVRSRDPVRPGQVLELDVPEPTPNELVAEDIPLDVVYRDDDVIVIDKPAGLVTHPAPGHQRGTLVNALLGMEAGEGLATAAGAQRPGIVHRLDRDTSGLIVVARNDAAQVSLQAQLKARRVRKTYLALVGGVVNAELGRIEKPIGRDPRNRMRQAITADGKPATTGYRVRERFEEWTMLELDLITGRTHQIRVHLASIGHAVAGDTVYAGGLVRRGPDHLERLFLHAWKLEFLSPGSGRLVRCEAPLPDVLESVLNGLRASDDGRS
jgi:23S rRNA pseudouridine1911/1915/1917 synthase